MSKADWHRLRAEVALTALSIPVETTEAHTCPSCKAPEKKLSVTRTHNGALFVCHRLSCGFRGFVSMDGSGTVRDTKPKPASARPFQGQHWELRDADAWEFFRKYIGFSSSVGYDWRAWGLRECGAGLLFECRGFHGELLGHITRSPDKTIRTYRAREGVDMYSVYMPDGSQDHDSIVVVEDCISAMAIASHGRTGVAILGTHLTPTVQSAIEEQSPRRLSVMLDPDARAKALHIAGQFLKHRATTIISATTDPKDCENLGDILKDYKA